MKRLLLVVSATLSVCALSSAQTITYNFDNLAAHSPLPISDTQGGVRADFTATGQGFSIQDAGVLGFTPAGFSGNCIYPDSVFAADLQIKFSRNLSSFSIMYAPEEYATDSSATMRVTAYLNSTLVGTATTTAPVPGTWPTGTLSFSSTQPFNYVVVHYDAAPVTGGDYGPIFMADNMVVTVFSTAVTQAWHRTIPNSQTLNSRQAAVTDKAGNFYFIYNNNGSLYFQKLSPAGNLFFDQNFTDTHNNAYLFSATLPTSIYATPVTNNQQWVDVVTTVNHPITGYDYWRFAQNRFPTNYTGGLTSMGSQLYEPSSPWANDGGFCLLNFAETGPIGPAGDSAPLFRNRRSGDPAWRLEIYSPWTYQPDASIDPIDGVYDDITRSWFVTGTDPLDPNIASWGKYPIQSVTRLFGGTVTGNASVQFSFVTCKLPGGHMGVILNRHNMVNGSWAHNFTIVTASNGVTLFTYPASGLQWGKLSQLTGYDNKSPIYGAGTYIDSLGHQVGFVEAIDWTGNQQWYLHHTPTDFIYPTSEGFYSTFTDPLTSNFYVEHADSGGFFDWGKQYPNAANISSALFTPFQNAFYVVASQNFGGVYTLNVDRFITGATLRALTCPPTIAAGGTLTIRVQLNGPAPSGGLNVGLTSFDPALTFAANGAQGLNVVVPQGQDHLDVDLDANTVNANTLVHLLAIHNGVRCNASSTVTP